MIKIKSLLMINWMYYDIQLVEFDDSTLITGVTGSGKSAMIDALQIIILGEAGGYFFNKSATGSKSERTLRTYLRGKYSVDEFKRGNKAFSSYLVAEFYDTIDNEAFCYGVMFDLGADDNPQYDFFCFDSKLEKEWFLNNNRVKSRGELKKHLKDVNVRYEIFTTNKDYRESFTIRVGIYDDNFFKLFRNAVVYTPLEKIEEFITKNICNIEDHIDVEKMRTAINEYHRISNDLKDFINRKNKLDEIQKTYVDYKAKLYLLQEQKYYFDRAKIEEITLQLKDNEIELEENIHQHSIMIAESEKLSLDYGVMCEKYDELTKLIAQSPEKIKKEQLKIKYKDLNNKIETIKKTGNIRLLKHKQKTSAWKNNVSVILENNLEGKISRQDLFQIKTYLAESDLYTDENFYKFNLLELSKRNTSLIDIKNAVLIQNGMYEQKQSEIATEIIECNQKIKSLINGEKQYDPKLLRFKRFLEEKLETSFGKKINSDILADLLDITDSRWVNVIEGYLSKQKMYLLVDPIYYNAALKVFKEFCEQNHNSNIGLIDGEKVFASKKQISPMSLSQVVKSTNKYAMAYAEYMLGHIIRVERIQELRNYHTSIMDNGMLYKGFTCTKMSSNLWLTHFIGIDSIKQQLLENKQDLAKLIQTKSEIASNIMKLNPLVTEETFTTDYIEVLSCVIEDLNEIPSLDRKCSEIFIEITNIDDHYVSDLVNQQDNIINKRDGFLFATTMITTKITKSEQRKKDIENNIMNSEDCLEELEQNFNASYNHGQFISEDTIARYQDILIMNGSPKKLVESYEKFVIETKTNLEKCKSQFSCKIQDFNRAHTQYSISTDISSNEWNIAYDKVRERTVDSYQRQVNEAYIKSEDLFRNEFINQLKGDIDTARREITGLSKALSEYTFGKTKYRFKCDPTDNTEIRKYYDLIMNPGLDGYSLKSANLYKEHEPLIKNLFSMFSLTTDDGVSKEEIEKNIQKFKSFQTYLKFDLVEIDEKGKEQPLSKMMGSKSGGERQTPFYIAVLASLMKVYKINENANSLRLVVFDEAFDKIDTSRIEEFISMLKKIGFQSIIAAPNEKIAYISSAVERTLVVVKPSEMTSKICEYMRPDEIGY